MVEDDLVLSEAKRVVEAGTEKRYDLAEFFTP